MGLYHSVLTYACGFVPGAQRRDPRVHAPRGLPQNGGYSPVRVPDATQQGHYSRYYQYRRYFLSVAQSYAPIPTTKTEEVALYHYQQQGHCLGVAVSYVPRRSR